MPMRITTLERLKQQAREGEGFFILLNHNLRSSKWIVWNDYSRVFIITNLIDDSEQVLTEQQIMDRQHTNIGFAMTKGALFKDDQCTCGYEKVDVSAFLGVVCRKIFSQARLFKC